MNSKTKDVAGLYSELQDLMCRTLEQADGKGKFKKHPWKKTVGKGLIRVMEDGRVIEKAGLNFSHVHGSFTPGLEKALKVKAGKFSATGISSIIHPFNPWVPIIHMNVRYFELDNGIAWFGGGIDLTPHYIDPADAGIFHRALKKVCDIYNLKFYPEFKAWADRYFFLPHRNETRGVGGIFFDRIEPEKYSLSFENMLEFTADLCRLYPEVYIHQMEKYGEHEIKDSHKRWQNLRRSRYVEFNLIYDRGTKFGLESGGNTESILVSMPPMAEWAFNYSPERGSPEEKTLGLLKQDIDWTKY